MLERNLKALEILEILSVKKEPFRNDSFFRSLQCFGWEPSMDPSQSKLDGRKRAF